MFNCRISSGPGSTDRSYTAAGTSCPAAWTVDGRQPAVTHESVEVAAALLVAGRQKPDCNTGRFASVALGISGIAAIVEIGRSFDGKH